MDQAQSFDDITRRNYAAAVLRPDIWIARADDLLHTAELLLPSVREEYERFFVRGEVKNRDRAFHSEGPIPTFCMLTAFGLENLLKAALIRRDLNELKEQVEKKGELPRKLVTHDLYYLMKQLNVAPIDWFDEIMVRRLTRSSQWFGRYPVPAKFLEYNTVTYSDGKQYSLPYLGSDDLERIDRIIRQLRTTLHLQADQLHAATDAAWLRPGASAPTFS